MKIFNKELIQFAVLLALASPAFAVTTAMFEIDCNPDLIGGKKCVPLCEAANTACKDRSKGDAEEKACKEARNKFYDCVIPKPASTPETLSTF